MSYHGKDPDQCRWVIKNFGTPEKLEYYKDNKGLKEWLEESRNIIAARELDY